MPLPLLAMLGISAGSSLIGGLANRQKTTKTSSTTKKVLTPGQQDAERYISGRIAMDPAAGLEPLRVDAAQRVNSRYAGAIPTLQAKLASSGMARSGKVAEAGAQFEQARLGDLAGVDADFLREVLNQRSATDSLAMQLLGQTFEQESNGTQTQPGNVLGGALGSGLDTMMSLYTMNQLLNGRRSSSPYSFLDTAGGNSLGM